MTDVVFHELINRFKEQGRTIEKIPCNSIILFKINPFIESFLGWDKTTLSHFTLLDCIPLATLSEEDVLSASQNLKKIIQEAIDDIKIEEENMRRLKRRALTMETKKNQYIWL